MHFYLQVILYSSFLPQALTAIVVALPVTLVVLAILTVLVIFAVVLYRYVRSASQLLQCLHLHDIPSLLHTADISGTTESCMLCPGISQLKKLTFQWEPPK